MTATVQIRLEPSDADISRMIRAGQAEVIRIAGEHGVLGADEVNDRYMRALHAAVVAGAVKPKRKRV